MESVADSKSTKKAFRISSMFMFISTYVGRVSLNDLNLRTKGSILEFLIFFLNSMVCGHQSTVFISHHVFVIPNFFLQVFYEIETTASQNVYILRLSDSMYAFYMLL